jgi:hypothetical protein
LSNAGDVVEDAAVRVVEVMAVPEEIGGRIIAEINRDRSILGLGDIEICSYLCPIYAGPGDIIDARKRPTYSNE